MRASAELDGDAEDSGFDAEGGEGRERGRRW